MIRPIQPLIDFKGANITTMIVRLLIDGMLHLVHIRKDSNKEQRTARVHEATTNQPVSVMTEIEKNRFKDEVNNKVYNLNPMTRTFGL